MQAAMKPYTVIGVGTGQECPRVHRHVFAQTPEEAICVAIDQLNNFNPVRQGSAFEMLSARLYQTGTHLLGAVAFEGHLPCLAENQGQQLRGDDRQSAHERDCVASRKPFTVVTVDPASSQVAFHHMQHADIGSAERNPALDFFLVAGAVAGHAFPVYIHQTAVKAWPTSRDQRVLALANKYSLDYMRHLSYHQAAEM